jgi:hypothetical protein
MKCLGLGEAGEGEAELGLYAGSLLQELKEKHKMYHLDLMTDGYIALEVVMDRTLHRSETLIKIRE